MTLSTNYEASRPIRKVLLFFFLCPLTQPKPTIYFKRDRSVNGIRSTRYYVMAFASVDLES